MPNLVHTNISVGWKSVPSGLAMAMKLSSYTSGRSPVEYTRNVLSCLFANALFDVR